MLLSNINACLMVIELISWELNLAGDCQCMTTVLCITTAHPLASSICLQLQHLAAIIMCNQNLV